MNKNTYFISGKHKILIAVLFFSVLITGTLKSESRHENQSNGSSNYESVGKHPYLFFNSDRIKKLQNSIKQDTSIKSAWLRIQARADRAVSQEGASGSVDDLGLAYLMTGEVKYASKIRQILLAFCSRETWGEQELLSRTPVWNSGLGLSRSCYSVALGYDCINDFLSPEERKTIVEGLIKLGILPTLNDWVLGEKRIHSFDSMGHNWWSACVYNAGIAVLAILGDDPRTQLWMDEIVKTIPQWFAFKGSVLGNKPKTFDQEGGFYESVNYASYAMGEFLKFRLAFINTLPKTKFYEISQLDKIDKFFIDASYPNSGPLMSVNFGDGNLGVNGGNPVMLLIANGFKKARYLWYLDQIQTGQDRQDMRLTSALGLVYNPDIINSSVPKTPGLPESALYPDMGWAMLRTSWEKDATMLAIKSGFTFNHSHADAGSFILFHNGKNLITDSGNSSYSTLEYSTYYCQSEAHNVILFNGKGQNPEDEYSGVKNPGKIYNLLDAGNFKYIYADATGPYSQILMRNFRHFLWIGNTILIIDDVKAFEPGQFEWLLHYDGTALRTNQDLTISNGSASVVVRPLFPQTLGYTPHDYPEKMKLLVKDAPQIRESDPKKSYFSITPSFLARDTKFITAILLPDKNNPGKLPRTERFESNNMMGVKIFENGTVTYVYLNLMADGRIMHQPSFNIFDGWETDAYMVAITYPEKSDQGDPDAATGCFVADGSYLRKNGKVVVNSLSKVFMISKLEKTGLNLFLEGQSIIDLRLRSVQKPGIVNLNNKKIDFSYNDKSMIINIMDGMN